MLKKLGMVAALGICVGLAMPRYLIAEDAPTTAPSEEKPKKERKVRISFLPYKNLKTLTDEQIAKIMEIHKKYLEERKELEKKRNDEINGLLTDAQKAELAELEAKKAADEKGKPAEKAPEKKD